MAISPLLHCLIHAEYNTSYYHDKDKEKAYYCVDCRGNSLSKNEKDTEHVGHRVLTMMKHTGNPCYKRDELLNLLGPDGMIDLTGIRIYNTNFEDLVYIKSPLKEKRVEDIGKPGCCFTCGRKMILQDHKPAVHCSIMCKHDCTATPEELDRAMRALEQQEALISLSPF